MASFYSLGAKRGGWLVHRGVQPDTDRAALAGAGLDVTGLEAGQQLVIERLRLDEPPTELPLRVDAAFDAALGRGLKTMWSSHSPVGSDSESFERAVAVERAWEEQFRDRPVVTLCPYVVGGLEAGAALGRLSDLGAGHDGVLVPSADRLDLFRPA